MARPIAAGGAIADFINKQRAAKNKESSLGATSSLGGDLLGLGAGLVSGLTGTKLGLKRKRRRKGIPARTVQNLMLLKSLGFNPTKNPMVAYKLTKYL